MENNVMKYHGKHYIILRCPECGSPNADYWFSLDSLLVECHNPKCFKRSIFEYDSLKIIILERLQDKVQN